jgi:hypothetical protein
MEHPKIHAEALSRISKLLIRDRFPPFIRGEKDKSGFAMMGLGETVKAGDNVHCNDCIRVNENP